MFVKCSNRRTILCSWDRTHAFVRRLVCPITQIKKLKDSTEAPKKGKLTDVAPVYHFFSEARLKTNLNKKSWNKFNNGVGYQSQQTKEMINTDIDDCLEDGVCTWVNVDVSKLQSNWKNWYRIICFILLKRRILVYC